MGIVVHLWFGACQAAEQPGRPCVIETDYPDFAMFADAVSRRDFIAAESLFTRRTEDPSVRVITARQPGLYRSAAIIRAEQTVWTLVDEVSA